MTVVCEGFADQAVCQQGIIFYGNIRSKSWCFRSTTRSSAWCIPKLGLQANARSTQHTHTHKHPLAAVWAYLSIHQRTTLSRDGPSQCHAASSTLVVSRATTAGRIVIERPHNIAAGGVESCCGGDSVYEASSSATHGQWSMNVPTDTLFRWVYGMSCGSCGLLNIRVNWPCRWQDRQPNNSSITQEPRPVPMYMSA